MQSLEVSGAVRLIYRSLGVKRLTFINAALVDKEEITKPSIFHAFFLANETRLMFH